MIYYIRTCLHKHIQVSFRQILLHTAWKILAGRQPTCVFLPCLQQNYARKSTHISCEDRFSVFSKMAHRYLWYQTIPEKWQRFVIIQQDGFFWCGFISKRKRMLRTVLCCSVFQIGIIRCKPGKNCFVMCHFIIHIFCRFFCFFHAFMGCCALF